jgi:hypothetical protein
MGGACEVEFYDIESSREASELLNMLIKRVHGILMVYSFTSLNSIKTLLENADLIDQLRVMQPQLDSDTNTPKATPTAIVIVGTKDDIHGRDRRVQSDNRDIARLAQRYACPHVAVSNLTGSGIEQMQQLLLSQLHNTMYPKQLAPLVEQHSTRRKKCVLC